MAQFSRETGQALRRNECDWEPEKLSFSYVRIVLVSREYGHHASACSLWTEGWEHVVNKKQKHNNNNNNNDNNNNNKHMVKKNKMKEVVMFQTMYALSATVTATQPWYHF